MRRGHFQRQKIGLIYIYICIVPPKKIETLFTYVIYICDIYIYIYMIYICKLRFILYTDMSTNK